MQWVIDWQRTIFHRRRGFSNLNYQLGKLFHRHFRWITKVDRTYDLWPCFHKPYKSFNKIRNIAKSPRLLTISIYSYGLVPKSLNNEIGYHTTIFWIHLWSISIKNTHNLHWNSEALIVFITQSFCYTLTFIVTSARPHGINISAIILKLRRNVWVTINLTSAGLQHFCTITASHV
ncbi:hypothetical protein AD951_06380 [Acetobacter malorum]|uniref:Uncharacterized protein n=1 Tax=Acetobacter malorum TaxID=178901 RepID=A0A149UNB3_9PROT|nr:hypothetical protein AD951_06380 [Acetobacter malorum]